MADRPVVITSSVNPSNSPVSITLVSAQDDRGGVAIASSTSKDAKIGSTIDSKKLILIKETDGTAINLISSIAVKTAILLDNSKVPMPKHNDASIAAIVTPVSIKSGSSVNTSNDPRTMARQ